MGGRFFRREDDADIDYAVSVDTDLVRGRPEGVATFKLRRSGRMSDEELTGLLEVDFRAVRSASVRHFIHEGGFIDLPNKDGSFRRLPIFYSDHTWARSPPRAWRYLQTLEGPEVLQMNDGRGGVGFV
jgi:hypothetical protein